MDLAVVSLTGVLIGLLLAGLVFWLLSYFGVPAPLAALAAVIVFLLCLAGGVTV